MKKDKPLIDINNNLQYTLFVIILSLITVFLLSRVVGVR